MTAQAWVTLVVGTVGIVGVLITLYQRDRADRRSEWWRRATWAVERTFSETEEEAATGFAVLAVLVQSNLITATERDMVTALAQQALEADNEDNDPTDQERDRP
ncbi:hypothetical protein BH683_012455 [Williamsia sp. 1138]|uniref:hypothetical protein n=1 Tax=Williamsia sp. 1138 TaxID=1903117 RepID=UPI000A10848A|nr:hypothetical protein [Williamsia sp. 1138]OZG28888.1 hypothetical protein BH683_012455 [Williamsia sp. 1138]